jgi:REP element-mobilizing transposase RayT
LGFSYRSWGGNRPGSGRKPKGANAGVSHKQREDLTASQPILVTMRTVDELRGLRGDELFDLVRKRLRDAVREDFRVVHFTVLGNHIHMVVEADDARALAKGMQGLSIRVARAVNRHYGRTGKVWADRYHSRVLKTPTEVRHALCYVLNNYRRHAAQLGRTLPKEFVDPCSSALWFDGWDRTPRVTAPPLRGGFPGARSWLLRVGWRKAGVIRIEAVPG